MLSKNSLLFYAVVFVANIIQCVTGFAGTALAMPFSLLLVGYPIAKPVLNALGVAASIGMVAATYKKINKHELTKILSFMLVGILAGEVVNGLFSLTAGSEIYHVLGVAVIAFAALGAFEEFFMGKPVELLFKGPKDVYSVLNDAASYVILLFAGLIHGLFVSGGPLLVLYAERTLRDKEEFRSTLSSCWIVLNSLIFLSDASNGLFAPVSTVAALAICMAVLVVAFVIGQLIAKKLTKRVFMALTFVLMVLSGAALFFK